MASGIAIPTADGFVPVDLDDLSEDDLTTLSLHRHAIRKVLANTDPWAATQFRGVSVAGHPLAWHPDDIEQLAVEGDDFNEFYIHVTPT